MRTFRLEHSSGYCCRGFFHTYVNEEATPAKGHTRRVNVSNECTMPSLRVDTYLAVVLSSAFESKQENTPQICTTAETTVVSKATEGVQSRSRCIVGRVYASRVSKQKMWEISSLSLPCTFCARPLHRPLSPRLRAPRVAPAGYFETSTI